MQRFFHRNGLFLGLSLLLIIALACAIGFVPKAELHLLLCDRHTAFRDVFYKYYTQVGEWVPYVVCVALLFYKAGWSVFTAAGTLLSGLMTQIVKRIVDAPRPVPFFADNYPDITLPLVEGVHMSHHYSFPSGHTTTFFALFFALCLIGTQYIFSRSATRPKTKNSPVPSPDTEHTEMQTAKTGTQNTSVPSSNTPNSTTTPMYINKKNTLFASLWQVLCFLLAALGGYSRIYLSQHFAADILGGICVGLLITALLYALFHRFENAKWWNWHIPTKKMHFSAKKVR